MVTQTSTTGAKKGPAQLSLPVVRRLFFLLLFGALGTPAVAVEDAVHQKCLQAADYKGCIEVMGGAAASTISPIQGLVDELKVLSSRLESVSLSSLSERAIEFRDALSLVDSSSLNTDYEISTYQGARNVDNMISALASAWQSRIYDATKFTSGTYTRSKYYLCRYLKLGVAKFNYAAPAPYHVVYNGRQESNWLAGVMEKCSPQEWQMVDSIQQYIAELTIDPEVKARQIAEEKRREARQIAEEKRRQELCQLEPWDRYLEENPGMKDWVLANPSLAEQRKQKFLQKPENKTTCSGYRSGGYGDSYPEGSSTYIDPNLPPKGGCNKYGICDY